MTAPFRILFARETVKTVAPSIFLGATACILLVLLSVLLTGSFVFEGADSPGEAEHVSPYFGGVVSVVITTGMIVAWQLARRLRDQ